ncbi:MAG: hypothetical protein AAB523_00085 [Patescibacteria group bacterium]
MKDTKDANKLATWCSLLSIASIMTSVWFFYERLHKSGIVLLAIALIFFFAAVYYLSNSDKTKADRNVFK